jgi:membrane-bound serine protease (ClpP class)
VTSAPSRLARSFVAARRTVAALCALVGLALLLTRGSPLQAQTGPEDAAAARRAPVHVRLEGELSAASSSLLRRAIAAARPQKRVVVVELDTPGGEVTLMWKLARSIANAREEDGLTFVAFVNEQALSAGSLVAMSCGEIYMAPGARIGAATPITVGLAGIEKAEEKFLASFRAEWRAWAERNRRPAALAEGMVDESVEVLLVEVDGLRRVVSGTEWDDLRARGADAKLVRTIADSQTLVALTAGEALEYGFSDGTVADLEELVEVAIGGRVADVLTIAPTETERFVALIAPFAPFLLVIAVVLALIELQTPGFGVAGIGSVGAFALLLASRYLTGLAGSEHLVAIGLGLVLILVEVFVVPGTFVAGILGGALFVWGLVASQLGPGFDYEFGLDRELLYGALVSTLGWTLVGMVGGMVLSRVVLQTPLGRFLVNAPSERPTFAAAVTELEPAHTSVGARARATTLMRPVGRVALEDGDGREYEATAPGHVLEPGTRLRVVGIDTGRLVVEPLDPPAPPADAGPRHPEDGLADDERPADEPAAGEPRAAGDTADPGGRGSHQP